ncbi:hypothetical protein ATL17_2098 [Maritalea mobilis]|uniref:CAAX prenyl protease 2/Lysostaphin resistance protein A-like domain-containing protein n=1 Tax=Maritalea mobilis TaxID=483324 RepID=A0A4R6VLT6_9HYPH|nr:type II CAAX endopeptidase family protein [Maritalea mobilis]TDQ64087.1 hypothetical protein ATL17_2098 [Maritalea mobilis]
MTDLHQHRTKNIIIYIATLIFGFAAFAAPNIFFGVTKINGGLQGINLAIIGVLQLVLILIVLQIALRLHGKEFKWLGWHFGHWPKFAAIGICVGLAWTIVQHFWLIPVTGGVERADMQGILDMLQGGIWGLLGFLVLGIVGGGIAEEFFNRGYVIRGFQDLFANKKMGLWLGALFSILFFAAGHLPSNGVEWMDILIPTVLYTALFIWSKSLVPSIFAHAVYNGSLIVLTYYSYVA